MNKRKRILALLLAVPLLCAAPFAQAAALGDVDGNGEIEVQDARLALRQAVGLENYEETDPDAFYACDADGNGEVDVADARMILRAAVGLTQLETADGVSIIKEYSCAYENETIWVAEIRNNTDEPLSVSVSGEAIDRNDDSIGYSGGTISVLGPKETTAVILDFFEAFDVDHVDYTLVCEETDGEQSGASNVTSEVFKNNYGAVVQLRNTGNESLQTMDVLVLFLDADGDLLEYGTNYYVDVDGPFRPGDVVSAQYYCGSDFDHVRVFCTGPATDADYDWLETVPASALETESWILPPYQGDTWHILRIRNTTEKALQLYFNTEAFDAENRLVGADAPYAESVGPGEETFAVSVFPGEETVRRVDAHISAVVGETSDSGFSDLKTEWLETDEGLAFTFRNEGADPISLVEYYAVFLDHDQAPVDFYMDVFWDEESLLKPGCGLTVLYPTETVFDSVQLFTRCYKEERTER